VVSVVPEVLLALRTTNIRGKFHPERWKKTTMVVAYIAEYGGTTVVTGGCRYKKIVGEAVVVGERN
jgi:hypothetical protein